MDDRPAAQKQQRLEQGVVDDMDKGPGQTQDCQHTVTGLDSHQRHPQTDTDDADIFNTAAGQQSLQVPLCRCQGNTGNCRNSPQQQYQPAKPDRQLLKKRNSPDDTVDPHLEHDAGHQGRDMTGGIGMGTGQPDMQRHDTGLGAKSDQGRHQHHQGHSAAQGQTVGSRKGKRTGLPLQQRKEDIQRHAAGMGGQQIDRTGPLHLQILLIGHQQQPGRKGHHLPGNQQQQTITGHQHQRHGGQ